MVNALSRIWVRISAKNSLLSAPNAPATLNLVRAILDVVMMQRISGQVIVLFVLDENAIADFKIADPAVFA